MLYERTRRLEERAELDQWAATIGRATPAWLLEGAPHDVLSGRTLGHALHPMLTDLAIGSLTSATILDVVGPRRWRSASRTLTAVGVLAVVPTVASGLVELHAADTRGRRVAAVHAVANAAASVAYLASWATKAGSESRAGRRWSIVGALCMGAGGYLGGHLSYVLRMGTGPRVGSARDRAGLGPEAVDHELSAESVARPGTDGVGITPDHRSAP